MFAFSTCWNSQRHSDGRAMLAEIRTLGFEYAELGHGVRMSLVDGIQRAVAALAGGTSSSRQRVPKDQVLDVRLPVLEIDAASLARHVEARKAFYDSRLLEIDAYLALHDGKRSFALGDDGSTTQADTHPT